ncbi:hypothetical protein [Coxiella-like endosymbiont]|uniref:hypothetical protein n=1 Tax=Coxiella-like endosymbiont TaxID=1592897 RepID=UPI00272B1FA2|nr:hypothetical protein [Coxiella-like endosymbiont]
MALQTQQTTTNGTTNLTLNGHAYKAKSNLFDIAPLNIELSLTQMNITALRALVTTALNLNYLGSVDTEFLHQIYSPFLNVLSQGALLSLDQLAFGTKEGTV